MLRPVPTPTRAKRRLGRFLADLREREEVSAPEAARELKTSKSTLLRYEGGAVMPVWSTVQSLLRLYNASTDEHQDAERLWQEAHDDAPPVRLPATAPSSFRKLVTAERDAASERTLAPLVVPGLLQTERYIRALMDAAGRFREPGTRVDTVISSRIARQGRLEGRDPLNLHVLLDEVVIHREVGGPDVMREQLGHLLDIGKRPNITLQVIPFSMGAYGTMAGDCTIVSYPNRDEPPNVYLEYPAGGAWIEDGEDVQRFVNMFGDVSAAALQPDASADLIRRQIGAREQR